MFGHRKSVTSQLPQQVLSFFRNPLINQFKREDEQLAELGITCLEEGLDSSLQIHC